MEDENKELFESSEPVPEGADSEEFAAAEVIHPASDSAFTDGFADEATVPDSEATVSGVGEAPLDFEFRFESPEPRLYEDAEFVSQGESTSPISYYVPSEKKAKEKKSTSDKGKRLYLKVASLCLVCAIIGGLAGAGAVMLAKDKDSGGQTQPPAVTDKPITPDVTPVSKTKSNANDVYAIGCQQVVGITTSVTYMNFFGQTSASAVSGSGFVVTSDGYIITNYHVIEYAYTDNSPVKVMFKDGSAYDAIVVGVEEDNDIAVLKIDATNLTPVSVGDSDSIAVGDVVYAIGNPLGELDFSMSTGSVSALDRTIVTESGHPGINMFQIDAAVNSGNSGGPVYNTSGEVIGVVTAKSGVSGTEGLGFAIPINDAVDIANDLITKGYVTGKAYMGVNIDTRYTSVYAQYYNMPEGAYVFNVENGSCAEKAGVAAGDIITQLGDDPISSYNDLNSAVRQFKAGETTEVTVYRSNGYVTLSITFDESKPNADSGGVNESGLSRYPQSGGFIY